MRITFHDGISRFTCIFVAFALLVVDFFTGPLIRFPGTFIIPVILAAWFHGLGWGVSFALAMPLVRFGYDLYWAVPDSTFFSSAINGVIRIESYSSFWPIW